MSDRDDSGAPRLRVDRLAAAMDAARARAKAAAENPAPDPMVPAVAPVAARSQVSADLVGRTKPDTVPCQTESASGTFGLSGSKSPVADLHGGGVRAPSVRPAAADPLLLTDDFRVQTAADGSAVAATSPGPEAAIAPNECEAVSTTSAVASPAVATPAAVVLPAAVSPPRPGTASVLAPAFLSLSGVATDIGQNRILQDVTFGVPKGAVTVLLGRKGAGKTTTLRTVMGLVPSRAGDIVLAGDRIDRWSSHRIARAGVGYVPETMSIFADLTVAENITLGAVSGRVTRDRLDWLKGLFPPLATFWRSAAGDLADGQKQMLTLARAMVEKRRLYLIDEPTKGFAPAVVDTVVAALRDLKLQGATILMVERNVAVARALGDACVVMADGKVTWRGMMADLDSDPALQARLLDLTLEDVA